MYKDEESIQNLVKGNIWTSRKNIIIFKDSWLFYEKLHGSLFHKKINNVEIYSYSSWSLEGTRRLQCEINYEFDALGGKKSSTKKFGPTWKKL